MPKPLSLPDGTRSTAEDFILTLDEMYSKTIEDLKHEGQRDDQHRFIRYKCDTSAWACARE